MIGRRMVGDLVVYLSRHVLYENIRRFAATIDGANLKVG